MGNEKRGRLSLPAVMTGLTVGMVALSLLIGGIIFVDIYRCSMIRSVRTSSEQITEQVENVVGDYMEDIQHSMQTIRDAYRLPEQDAAERLNALVQARPDITAVTAYDAESGELLQAWTGSQALKSTIRTNLSFDAAEIPEPGELHISTPHVESIFENSYPWVVSISSLFYNTDGTAHVLVMDSRFSEIASYIDNVGIGRHGYSFIMDREGNIIYHPQQQLIFAGLKTEDTVFLKQAGTGSFERGGVLYTIRERNDGNWRIVAVSFVREMILEGLFYCVFLLAALLLLVVFAALLSSYVLSRMISEPINRLTEAMREFEEDAQGFIFQPTGGSREMQELSNSFGQMVLRIQELMQKVRNEEISLRKTELRALQAQINPHFLYNTLDSIAWMCEDGRSREAVSMVNALARLFRISISKGHELIPVAKEVEHAESYLQIQKFRYKDQFDYAFEVEESCGAYYCNKITLQPLIENAIYHGLNRMIDRGMIRIRIFEEGEELVFCVEDNGVGMTKEQCETILAADSGQGGIGMKNVNDRVKIYFGEQYGMKIESEPDVGTKVWIRMPKLREERYEYR